MDVVEIDSSPYKSLESDPMRKSFQLFAAACVLTAAVGCQPADTPTDISVDVPVETGDANTTAAAEAPVVEETPAEEAPAAE